jgi:hypothetical protein
MAENENNRTRIFADLVSVDAWYKSFSDDCVTADLHIDAAFRESVACGGEEASKIRFRLSLKRAEVVVIVPPYEPVKIPPEHVVRDEPEFQGKKTTQISKSSQAAAKAKGHASLSETGVAGSIEAGASGEHSINRQETTEVHCELRLMDVRHSKTDDGHHRWELTPGAEQAHLSGRGWDASQDPRCRLVDTRKPGKKQIGHAINIEVRCLGEDLKIEDIELKDETKADKLKAIAGFGNRRAAAEAYIRERLTSSGLPIEPNAVVEKFARLCIAKVSATATDAYGDDR